MKKLIGNTKAFTLTLGILASLCVLTSFSGNATAHDLPAGEKCQINSPKSFTSWSDEGLDVALSHIACVWSEHPVLLIGETHGADQPLDLVTALIERQSKSSKLAIGLELPSIEDECLSQFLTTPITKQSTDALLSGKFWSSNDGRASQSLVKFLTRVNALKKSGRDIEVFGMEDLTSKPRSKNPAANKELGMAEILKKRAKLGRKIIAIGGDFHMRIEDPESPRSTSVPSQLQVLSPYVLYLSSTHGAAWTCATMNDCGVHERPQGTVPPSDEATLEATSAHGIHVEKIDLPLLTASPPAKI
ncbi:hypothetical protein XSP_001750 [Xanthomonas euroxanthea]|uniref:ChaN family lipoprotein n=1 Tax=Xanthomonas euroxanthea TaxID=2259622 RepID=A0A8E4EQZ4_9XANT|nr:hypothetical protein [Xanthomonas euroxanthea]CAD1790796.1 hypothetical protein XSP_001750 [Xanthomonas euroxanthea]SYZ56777.1 hypothetical protein CPBF367_34470 [Xanthomonas arboricola pv. juglandis]